MKECTGRLMDGFFARHPEFGAIKEEILAACGLLLDTYIHGGKLLVCGNGGSCADADHIVGELMKGFLLRRPLPETERTAFGRFGPAGKAVAGKLQRGLPAVSLCAHAALMSAFENDVDPALVYAQQAYAYARPGDLLIGISTSGNAENVRAAAMAAGARGAKVIALTGSGGGELAPLADCAIRAPERETYRVQECHLAIYHFLCAYVESELFDE